MSSDLKYRLDLVIGDWSHDGHGMTDIVGVHCNRNIGEVNKAYEAAVKLTGMDLSEDVCSEYEDRNIQEDARKVLEKFGLDPRKYCYFDKFTEPDEFSLDGSDKFAVLYLDFCKLGDPDLVYEIEPDGNAIKIGGYGLFA